MAEAKRDKNLKVLGLDGSATGHDIRRAYRRLALQCHPDQCGEGGAARFREIQAAYEELSRPAEPMNGSPPVRHGAKSGRDPIGASRRRMSLMDRAVPLTLDAEEARCGGWVRVALPVTQSIPLTWGACEIRRSRMVFEIFLPPGLENGMILTIRPPAPGAEPIALQIRIPGRTGDFDI